MKAVRFHEEVRAELVYEVRFYTAVNRDLGERFDKAVRAAISRAVEFPGAWLALIFGTRRVLPRKFPFSVVYLIRETEIFVVAVAPDSRKPRYWRSRLR